MRSPLKVVDLFCGAGGTSTGLAQACKRAGRRLELMAINHWEIAVETHSANHPEAEHFCARLDQVDPSKVFRGRLDLLVASPECTHHSVARGGRPMEDQSRASAWEVVRWTTALRPRWILVENVAEFRTWGPLDAHGRPLQSKKGAIFSAWVAALESLNYTVEFRVLNAADFGAATTRRRLYILARLGRHRALPWPDATHAPAGGIDLFGSSPWRAAREVIDWTLPGESIFTRRRPLAEATLRRIEAGLRKFGGKHAEAFIVVLRNNQSASSLNSPLGTITCSGAHFGLCQPFVLPNEGYYRGNAPRSVEDPLPTLTSRGGGTLVQPFVLGQQSCAAPRGTDQPLPTIATAGAISLVEPFLVPFFGERAGQAPRNHSLSDPLPAVTGQGAGGLVEPFLVNYNGTGKPFSIRDPLPTQTSKDRFGLVQPAVLDIRFRMLQPHELAAAMGFPAGYQFAGTKADIVRQIGNAVQVDQAEALASAILAAA